MPKRGSRLPPESYFEHDDRAGMRRTVSFKRPHKSFGGRRMGNIYMQLDSDVDMGGGQSQYRGPGRNYGGGGRGNQFKNGRGRGRRQNSPVPMRSGYQIPTSSSYWYRVTIPYGSKYDKKWVIDTLNAAIAPETFTAVAYTTMPGKESYFYVDEYKVVTKLNGLNGRISTDDGFKLKVLVRPLHNPVVTVDDNLKECLKLALAKRFNAETNALNLSRLHLDPDLLHKFVPLNQRLVLSTVLSIVTENCQSLQALDLSHNLLINIDGIKSFIPSLSQLRILHLANNRLTHVSNLDSLKGLDLEELLMDSNPLCAKYEDQGAYVSDVRKRLPKLLKLDGVVLPPPILFDVEKTELPRSKGSFLCNNEGKNMVRQFLEQYYAIFDSSDRSMLKDAYHEKAMLSLTCNYSAAASQGSKEKSGLSAYLTYNRNLKRVSDLERRMQTLKSGHSEIMDFLSHLPNTQHDPLSFAVDLLLFTPQLIQICVNGVFRERRPSGNGPIRAFCRCLVVVPQGQGFCIVNETLTISQATSAQSAAAFKTNFQAPPVVSAEPSTISTTSSPAALFSIDSTSQKRQMVERVALLSGMNMTWSQKCLDETNWNLEQAIQVFSELHRQGTIPAEAFQ